MEPGNQLRKRLAAEIRQAKRSGTWDPPRRAEFFFDGVDNIQLPAQLTNRVGLKKAYFLSMLVRQYCWFHEEGWLELDGAYPKDEAQYSIQNQLSPEEIYSYEKFFQETGVLQISKHKISDKVMYRINIDKLKLVLTAKSDFFV